MEEEKGNGKKKRQKRGEHKRGDKTKNNQKTTKLKMINRCVLTQHMQHSTIDIHCTLTTFFVAQYNPPSLRQCTCDGRDLLVKTTMLDASLHGVGVVPRAGPDYKRDHEVKLIVPNEREHGDGTRGDDRSEFRRPTNC